MPRELRRSTSTLKRSRSPESSDNSTPTMSKFAKTSTGDIHNARQARRVTLTSSNDSAWQRGQVEEKREPPLTNKPLEFKRLPVSKPLQDRYTPEALFLMLKEYAFSGKLASVGVRGPTQDQNRPKSTDSRGWHGINSVRPGGKQDIWTDEAEFAFLAAELYLPPATSSKVMFMQKPCGRNEIIALIISFALGKYMTRKQVSSHLQVVRQRKRMNLEVKCLFDQSALDRSGGGSSPESGTPKLRGIHPRLFEIIGIHPDSNLSEMPKPNWILLHESGQSPQNSTLQEPNRTLMSDGLGHTRGRQSNQYHQNRSGRAASQRDLPKVTTEPVEYHPAFTKVHTKTSRSSFVEPTYQSIQQDDQLDELDSDLEHDERELEQVSDSTPRASPDPALRRAIPWADTCIPTIHTNLGLQDLTVRLGSKDVWVSKDFLVTDLPMYSADKAPKYGWQLPSGPQSKRSTSKYFHVTLGVNLSDIGSTTLTGLTPTALTLDLGLQTLSNAPVSRAETIRLSTSSGFLDTPREKSHCVELARFNGDHRTSDAECKILRPLQPYKDDTLPYLVKKSRDPATTLVPYYWILQEASSTTSIIKVLYTFEATQQWSIRASEIIL